MDCYASWGHKHMLYSSPLLSETPSFPYFSPLEGSLERDLARFCLKSQMWTFQIWSASQSLVASLMHKTERYMRCRCCVHEWVWAWSNKTLLTTPGSGPDLTQGLLCTKTWSRRMCLELGMDVFAEFEAVQMCPRKATSAQHLPTSPSLTLSK